MDNQTKQQIRTHLQSEAGSDHIALVEEGGFEPPKRDATDLQSAPFGHSGTPPYEAMSDGQAIERGLL